jgi:glycosyltransferase involved in cell wall biosynthesis
MAPADYAGLDVRTLRKVSVGPVSFQYGAKLDWPRTEVLMLDLGWSIISNPRYLLEARARGVARVGWSKGISQDAERLKAAPRRHWERLVVGQCDALVVYGEVSRRYFLRMGYPPERVFVAWNSPDTAAITHHASRDRDEALRLRATLSLGRRPVIGYLGKLTQAKSVQSILRAYEIARQQGALADLVIAGKGPEASFLRAAAAASVYAADIRFVEAVPIGSEGAYHRLFDLYVSFSQGGLGLLEAAAAGCAVATTPEPFPEVEPFLEPGSAFVAAAFTPEALAEQMARAMAQPDLRQTTAAQARQRVLGRYSHEKMIESIDAAVDAASSHHGRAAAGRTR